MNVRVLNLGAGVQSTTIYLMMIDGELPRADVAIFADTGDEPKPVYQHVEFLKTLGGPEIITVTKGNLGDNLVRGVNSTGQRFVAIPSFLSMQDDGKNDGIGKRQCTKEYKAEPIEREIRRIWGASHTRRQGGQLVDVFTLPADAIVTQVFGLSFDEPRRVARVKGRYEGRRQWRCEFPLFDDFVTRGHCKEYLAKRLPDYEVPRSACVFCPFRSDEEWLWLL